MLKHPFGLIHIPLRSFYQLNFAFNSFATSSNENKDDDKASHHLLVYDDAHNRKTQLAVRANAYRQIGNFNLAMRDYLVLYKMGNTAAIDSMRTLFTFCNVKQTTFPEFIASLIKPGDVSTSAHVDMAPDFTATDLQGKTVHLSDFKGKLIVINIWG